MENLRQFTDYPNQSWLLDENIGKMKKQLAHCQNYNPKSFDDLNRIGNFLEKFCKAVMMRMSIQFSELREISTF